MVSGVESPPQGLLCDNLCLGPCRHPRKPGQTRCNSCAAAYFRVYRKTSKARAARQYREEGREEALRSVRVLLLEAGDFTAAELVRGLD
jgi:hypothetical protein